MTMRTKGVKGLFTAAVVMVAVVAASADMVKSRSGKPKATCRATCATGRLALSYPTNDYPLTTNN